MKSRNVRFTTALVTFGLVIALAGLIAPTALGASGNTLVFVAQPQDAKAGATITSSDLLDGTSFVKVKMVDATTGATVTNSKALVSFKLASDTGDASGDLRVIAQPLDASGVATFGAGTLKILSENEPQFTNYRLIPVTTKNPLVTGPASSGFDVWEDGEACTGGNDTCQANLRGGNDKYTLSAAGTLGASELTSGELPGLVCPGQAEIFANTVFSYATTGSNTPVFLENHITRADWRASANNGQAHADWCIGLVHESDWANSGAVPAQMDTDLDGQRDLWVALAPKCPVANPSGAAPCILSQKGDGKGGSISLGWLPAGDPPRRT
jgi:hypothetical protein